MISAACLDTVIGQELMRNRQLLALVKFGSKEKREAAKEAGAYMERFRGRVEEGERKLKGMLELGKDEAYVLSRCTLKTGDGADVIREKRDKEFRRAFKESYRAASPFGERLEETEQRAKHCGFAAMYPRSKKLTADARALVAKFDQVAQRIEHIDTAALTANDWKEEDKATAKVLAAGKRVGMDKYQSILTASKQHMDNEDTRVAGHLYLADPPAAGIWGKVAKKQEKAARKLVRATEMDEV